MHKQDGDNKINKEQQKKLDKAIDKMLGLDYYFSTCHKCDKITTFQFRSDADDVQETRCPVCGYICQAWKAGEWK